MLNEIRDYSNFHRSYRQRVISNAKESVYQAQGGFTFFIPVEEGFKVRYKAFSITLIPTIVKPYIFETINWFTQQVELELII